MPAMDTNIVSIGAHDSPDALKYAAAAAAAVMGLHWNANKFQAVQVHL